MWDQTAFYSLLRFQNDLSANTFVRALWKLSYVHLAEGKAIRLWDEIWRAEAASELM